ncbi:hypothetical protein VTK26DRAFT_279 [Humicola hyalothermophila]
MSSKSVPAWASWQSTAPPLSSSLPQHGGPFPFPSSPRPTVEDADEDETTDFEEAGSETESYASSEGKTTTPDNGRPREAVIVPPDGPPQERAEIEGVLKSKEQAPSLDVLTTEIRKMIQQELGQMQASAGPGARNPHGSSPLNSPVGQRQPWPPVAQANRSPFPHQVPASPATPEAFPRTQPGVQWSSTVPPPPPSGIVPGDPSVELNPIDKKWGVLFDQNGVATKRWEQVVRGLGRYLMDEFLPQKTLVITPDKMAAFYSYHRIECEPFRLAELFRHRYGTSYSKLADLYQQLGCEYYLVPVDSKSRPTVPGLTPVGWTQWMTLAVRSYPDEESQRLAKVVAALPINAESLLDGKPERLPKQLSRHLLPAQPDRKARALFGDALTPALEALHLLPALNTSSRPPSPRSRYRPSTATSPSSPPPSPRLGDKERDRDRDRGRSDRDRERSYHHHHHHRDGGAHVRTYESNGSARRDPPPSSAARQPPSPPPPPANSRRRASPLPPSSPKPVSPNLASHRPSIAIVPGTGATIPGRPDRGYTWPHAMQRTLSDEGGAVHGRGGSGSKERERQRERERERERDRDGDRNRERDRDRDWDRERERTRETRDRELKRRGRERDRDRDKEREKERERERERDWERRRREASVASVPDRRNSGRGPVKRIPVVVKDERNRTWSDFITAK